MAYCMKPNCRNPAGVVLGYNYEERLVFLEDAPGGMLPPQTYAVCSACADSFGPPRGWELRDERARPRLYATPFRPTWHDRQMERSGVPLTGRLNTDN